MAQADICSSIAIATNPKLIVLGTNTLESSSHDV